MAADYRVDLDGLQRLIDDAAKLKTRIEDLATEIDKGIEQLHVTWTGVPPPRLTCMNDILKMVGALKIHALPLNYTGVAARGWGCCGGQSC